MYCINFVVQFEFESTELARRLNLSVPGVGYAVERGERIAREANDQLLE